VDHKADRALVGGQPRRCGTGSPQSKPSDGITEVIALIRGEIYFRPKSPSRWADNFRKNVAGGFFWEPIAFPLQAK